MCSNLSQTYCQKQKFLIISGEVSFQPACLSYSHQHCTPYNHTHFFSNHVLSMPVMLLCACGTGHCTDWLDAVYRVPGSTGVWTVQHGAGPPSCGHLLFTQPYCLGPCPVLGRNCMFHRIWRSVLQMHWGAQCNIYSCQNMLNTNSNGLCSCEMWWSISW